MTISASLSTVSSAQLTTRIPLFSTELVDVWRTIIHPHQPLSMHRHAHSRIVIPLSDTRLTVFHDNGAQEDVLWVKGQAYLLPADPPDELHGDVNEQEQPAEVIVVQFKQ